MGISPSKRVAAALAQSDSFNSACGSVFDRCLDLTQRAFPGLLPYQLATASNLLHSSLTELHHHPVVTHWLKSPPNRAQIDSASLLALNRHRSGNSKPDDEEEEEVVLDLEEFKAFAVDLFTEAILDSARGAVLRRLPIGVGGIVGVGALAKSGKDLVGAAVGVYALGVATSVYISLSG